MDVATLTRTLEPLFAALRGRSPDADLEAELQRRFAPDGALFGAIEAACHAAIADGWMCAQGEGNRRFGRVIEAGEATGGFSVDVVDLTDLAGPHHRHPNGEICMVMPQTPGALFDGRPAGWCVYAAGTAHRATVSGGRALVLYLLPDGAIEFTDLAAG